MLGLRQLAICVGLFWSSLSFGNQFPAPWTLVSDGYIIISSSGRQFNLDYGFIPEGLRDDFTATLSVTMLLNYKESNVGPYQELLYIPGNFTFADGKSHMSISKIYVSSEKSVIGGQENWGIPKELGQFAWQSGDDGTETVTVSNETGAFAKFTAKGYGPWFPAGTFILPRFFKSLAQERNGTHYVYQPSAKGWAQLATLKDVESLAEFFPDLNQGLIMSVIKVSDFVWEFPEATLYPLK